MATAPRSSGTPPPQARRQSIRRRAGPASPVSFDGLRSEAVRRAQALSGHTWSDYNLHDPGVTILEQLCYALTDLVYRIGFPVADHLAGPDDRIDFASLALHGPAQVFPCRPTTVADYRRALLDTLDALDNAWVGTEVAESGPSIGVNGLFRIALEHTEQVDDEAARAAARQAAGALYRRQRNLCEDLDAVTSVAAVDCQLQGAFEIGSARSPEDILADILDECARAIAGGVAFRSFQAALADGATLDDILDASHTRRGVIAATALRDADRDELFVGDLVARLCTIEGVRAVRHLAIAKGDEPATGGSISWALRKEALRLRLPSDAQMLEHLRLIRAGSTVAVSAAEVREKYLDLRTGREARRHGRQDIASLVPPPSGTHRDLRRYFSIQNHFPAVYGINAHGLPASATPEARAMAAQLKTYLAMFEQVMADGAAHLHHLRDLFSARSDVRRTYWWQPLGDDIVPGLGALLAGTPEENLDTPDSRARHDAFHSRRHRVLDHLLALHGETYTQNTLRQLACYYAPAELEEMLLANKLAYLGHILHIGRNRGSGFDYGKPSWDAAPDRDAAQAAPPPGSPRTRAAGRVPARHADDDESEGEANVSGFQLRSSLLLGFRYQHSRPLTRALREAAVEIHGSTPADRDADPLVGGVSIVADDQSAVLQRVPTERRLPPGGMETGQTFESLRTNHGLLGLASTRVSHALLRHGVDLGNYRVGRTGGTSGIPLLFRPEQARRWWILGTYDTIAAANRAANHLRRFLVHLNVESEGMHVVEHALLRPSRRLPEGVAAIPPAFHTLRLTVVLPAWTARGQTAGFRRLAEETVQINCPAHVLPGCLWLDYADMAIFEQRYERWLDAKLAACRSEREPDVRTQARASAEADAAGRAVADFLMRKGIEATPGAHHA
jgi:hypothetical protein